MALNDANLVAYYKMEGNSNDSISTNNGVDTSITYNTGLINNDAVFNGSSSYINLPTGVMNVSNSFSFSFWFKVSSFPSTNYGAMIMGKFNNSGGNWNYGIINMYMGNTSPYTIGFSNRDNSGTISGGTLISNPVTATWYHVVYVYDKSIGSYGTNYIYLNGSLVVTSANSRYYTDNSNPVRLGKSQDSWQYAYFNGQIDELGFWSRALSAAEVTTLYNGGAGLQYPFTLTPTNTGNFLMFF